MSTKRRRLKPKIKVAFMNAMDRPNILCYWVKFYNPEHLNRKTEIRNLLLQAASSACEVVSDIELNLNEHGFEGFMLMEETYLTIHSSKFDDLLTISLYTPGSKEVADNVIQVLMHGFKPGQFKINRLNEIPREALSLQ